MGDGGKKRANLRWENLEAAKQSEFFRWFSFVEVESVKDAGGNILKSFRPEGEKFRSLVKLDVALDKQSGINTLQLFLARRFVDDNRDGIFARDIAKSFLRSALPEPDADAVTVLAEEIEHRHNFSVLTRAPAPDTQLPSQPSTGFLAYAGEQQFYEETFSQSSLRIEQTKLEGDAAVVLIIQASR
jgi:hypothetical protein